MKVKRVFVSILFVLLLSSINAVFFVGQDKQSSGGQVNSIVVEFFNNDGTLYLRKKYKKGETVSFPEYVAPDGYYFEGWKIAGGDEIITSYKVKSSTVFTPFLSQVYFFDGSENFDYLSNDGVSNYSSVSFDFKVVSGDYFAISLFGNRWHNDAYEYIVFDNQGITGNSSGVQISSLSDGWLSVKLSYWVYESACLSIEYNLHDDYGSMGCFHVCKLSSEYACQRLHAEVAHVLFKNITFNK